MKKEPGRRVMKTGRGRRILTILLTVVLLGSLAGMGYRQMQYREAEVVYQEAEELVQLPNLEEIAPQTPEESQGESSSSAESPDTSQEEVAPVYVDPYAQALRDMDFAALREQNEEVLGWIVIPNTRISYPLVQGGDNSYYLNHTWRKNRSVVGAIFMEYRCSAGLSDFNTIIYGHRMNDRSMFGRLLDYKAQSHWESHPRFYITDDSGTHTYEIFAAYEAAVRSTPYCIDFASDTEKQTFIDYCVFHSVIDTGVVPTVGDRIVTLSTCTGNGHATRWVVQGVERVEAPAEETVQEEPQTQEETPPEETTENG